MPKEEIINEIKKVKHPEIDYTLVELGIVDLDQLKETDSKITITMKFPFLGVPIQEMLIDSIKDAISNAESKKEIEIKTAEMSGEERERFMKMAQERWIA